MDGWMDKRVGGCVGSSENPHPTKSKHTACGRSRKVKGVADEEQKRNCIACTREPSKTDRRRQKKKERQITSRDYTEYLSTKLLEERAFIKSFR